MIFHRFTVGYYPINGYLVADPRTRIAAFVDPGGFHDEIDVFIKQNKLQLRHLLFTHGHDDHTGGLSEFMQRYSVKGYAGIKEVKSASQTLHGGEQLEVGQLSFLALSTPGHTPGGISFYCYDRVFTGDALFSGSVGGTYSEKNAQQQLNAVRQNIFTLPESTLVCPAHGPLTTVAAEKYFNPFFE